MSDTEEPLTPPAEPFPPPSDRAPDLFDGSPAGDPSETSGASPAESLDESLDESPAEGSGVGSGEGPDHQADGLELARALTKATIGTTPARRAKLRRRETPARGRVSGSHPDDRDPQLLDSTLSRLVEDHGWSIDLRVHGVFGRWGDLVGADVAAHCTPESFDDGKLVVRTDSTAWATQLRLLAPTVVRRLNEELGHGTVTVIEVLGPHGPTWKKGRRSTRDGRGPRDTYG